MLVLFRISYLLYLFDSLFLVVNSAPIFVFCSFPCVLSRCCVYVGVTDQSGIVWSTFAVCFFKSPPLKYSNSIVVYSHACGRLQWTQNVCITFGSDSPLNLTLLVPFWSSLAWNWSLLIDQYHDSFLLHFDFFTHAHEYTNRDHLFMVLTLIIIPSLLVIMSVSGLVVVAVSLFCFLTSVLCFGFWLVCLPTGQCSNSSSCNEYFNALRLKASPDIFAYIQTCRTGKYTQHLSLMFHL